MYSFLTTLYRLSAVDVNGSEYWVIPGRWPCLTLSRVSS